MIALFLAITISYLLGSIPTAYLFGKLAAGRDIRREGSGNIGATNVFRVIGKLAGVVVLLFDIAKGFIAVALIGGFFSGFGLILSEEWFRVLLALAVVCGHNWTIFLHFKGGKGVATSMGVLLGLATQINALWPILGLTILVWILAFFLTHYVSVGSILAAISLPLWMVVFSQCFSLVLLSATLCLFIVYKHKSNIKRLFRKEEKRIYFIKPGREE